MRPEDLPRPQFLELMRDFQDHAKFCRESLSIRNPVGNRVPMELSPGQLILTEAARSQRARGKPVRLVVLKTRRSQFTSGACSLIFHEIPFFSGRRATIIANNYKPAGIEAFDYLVQFQKSYQPFTRHGAGFRMPRLLKPGKLVSPVPDKSTLQLLWDNAASVDVMSAEGGDVGRGGGRHVLLLDELAFWRAALVTLTAILNMVPKDPETAVIAMSTANGIGGGFYDLVQQARDPANESGFEFLFFGWLEHPPYRLPLIPEEAVKLQASLNPEEKLLVNMHSASLEQLAWRRLTIATECRQSVDLFHQEYPTTPEEAFLMSGRPRFRAQDIAQHPACQGTVGDLDLDEFRRSGRILFKPNDRGALTIWKKPEQGHQYVSSADPSQGRDVSLEQRGSNPDFAVNFMTDRWSGEQVAQLRERLRPGEFAEYSACLCKWYNYAYFVPEANDAGFMDAFIRTGYPIELIYTRQRDPTDRRPPNMQELGYRNSTEQERSLIVFAAEEALHTMAIIVKSPIAIRECQTFVIKPGGKAEHRDDEHDDCVIAIGLNMIGIRTAPRKPYDPGGIQRKLRVSTVGSGLRKRDEDDDRPVRRY